jgi:hypothetical protein
MLIQPLVEVRSHMGIATWRYGNQWEIASKL